MLEDPYFSRLLWYIIAGTRGGVNRAKILKYLIDRPYNSNQLANLLAIQYKTVQHHLKVMVSNGMVSKSEGTSYGSVFFLTPLMENHKHVLDKIWEKVRQKELRGDTKEEGRY